MKKGIWGRNCLICKNPCKIFQKNLFDDRFGTLGRYSVYKCSSCGFGRLEPLIDRKKIGQFYANYYPLNSITAEQVKKDVNVKPNWLAWLTGTNNTAHWQILPKSTVLDIGSASGVSLVEIKKMGGIAYGIEPDPSAQKIAKKLKLQVYKGFINDNPFPGKKFDFITASQVIEHELDPSRFLEAATKRLDQGGKIILSFPNGDSLYRRIFGKVWINWHVPYHCNFFTKRSFEILANSAGFRIIKLETVTPNIWTILQVRRSFVRPNVGRKNAIWVLRNQWSSNNGSVKDRIISMLLKIVLILAIIIVAPVDRIIDFLGQGESFIVFLEKLDAKKS